MSVRDWPSGEQPREKLLKKGAAALSDAEILAIFLRTGMKGKSVLDLARELLSEFGSLRRILSAPSDEFCSKPGLGLVKYVQLQAALELGRRYLYEDLLQNCALSDPEATYRYLMFRMRDEVQEIFVCLFLDSQHRVLCCEEMSRGTIDQASVYPREIVRRVLHHNAASVILSHNHPGGLAKPSLADREVTQRIQAALDLVGAKVLDHIIIGEKDRFSFAEAGLLRKM